MVVKMNFFKVLILAGVCFVSAPTFVPAFGQTAPDTASNAAFPGRSVAPEGQLLHRGLPVPQAHTAPLDGLYLYVTVPGVANEINHGGAGVLVFDVGRGFKFVKRIDLPELRGPETSKGVIASTATGLLYVGMTSKLVAIDLETDQIKWMQGYDGWCCDRGEISPDGTIIYQAALDNPKWYVVSALNGQLIDTLPVPARAHNTQFSPRGDKVYLSPANNTIYVADPRRNRIVQQIGPFSARVRPFVINGAETLVYASVNNLLGVGVADLKTGRVIAEVPVPDKACTGGGHHHTCTHGMALTRDEKEVWVADAANAVHVFDATVMPPKYKMTIQTRDAVGWINCSIDGSRMYPSSGEVIDTNSKRILTVLTDERGEAVESEKILEVRFSRGKLVKTGSQWCNGEVRRKPLR